ncbi:MAG: endonuclease [Deltaproteobacteria bacterium HGW-Deltaproteobacteria-18]|jgi:hypothetical protein|nr:MAG: endonuclease [Deltaproteobacteria bacterium HGW-Deltaproteobacteria-18]
MLKLNHPTFDYVETINRCCSGITGNPDFRGKVISSSDILISEAENYERLAPTGSLYTIQPTPKTIDENQIVIGNMSRSDLLKLYSTYFVDQDKPARPIYDIIMASAKEKCPFCGGIGRPKNLDHYLPKAHFPQFSIFPLNLIPSCRDCNMDGKGHTFATCEEEHILHPYLDDDRFFHEQWLHARHIIDTDDCDAMEFYVNPPDAWTPSQKRRAMTHFVSFDLGFRYSLEAASRLGIYLRQIEDLTLLSLDIETAKNVILQPVIDSAPFINHWERVMCISLINELN